MQSTDWAGDSRLCSLSRIRSVCGGVWPLGQPCLPPGLGTAADDSYFDVQVQRMVAFPSVPGEAGSWGHQAHEALGPSPKPRPGAPVALTAVVGWGGGLCPLSVWSKIHYVCGMGLFLS